MKHYDSLWQLLRDLLLGDPKAKQQERFDAAVKDAAEVQGDVLVARMMLQHYSRAAAKINHSQQWWEYAATRQKAEDYGNEYNKLCAKAEAVGAKVEAERARLVHLLNGPGVVGAEDQA
jgi:hypothetical protein